MSWQYHRTSVVNHRLSKVIMLRHRCFKSIQKIIWAKMPTYTKWCFSYTKCSFRTQTFPPPPKKSKHSLANKKRFRIIKGKWRDESCAHCPPNAMSGGRHQSQGPQGVPEDDIAGPRLASRWSTCRRWPQVRGRNGSGMHLLWRATRQSGPMSGLVEPWWGVGNKQYL